MSKERELLERVWASERWDMPEDLQADIQELLAQPEPFMLKNRQLTGSLISYDEMYKKGYAQAKIDLKPEPLSDGTTADMWHANKKATHADSYWAGVSDAEKAHKIG